MAERDVYLVDWTAHHKKYNKKEYKSASLFLAYLLKRHSECAHVHVRSDPARVQVTRGAQNNT